MFQEVPGVLKVYQKISAGFHGTQERSKGSHGLFWGSQKVSRGSSPISEVLGALQVSQGRFRGLRAVSMRLRGFQGLVEV